MHPSLPHGSHKGLSSVKVVGAILALSMVITDGCVYMYGESPLAKAHLAPKGSRWNYAFHGADWVGADKDNKTWMCTTGHRQSPINVVGSWSLDHPVNNIHKTSLDFGIVTSNGSNVEVINTGHTIQVQWEDPTWHHNVSVAVPVSSRELLDALNDTTSPTTMRVQALPLQFHFHTASEHLLDGHLYPLELHVVSTVKDDGLPGCTAPMGCLTVVGVLFELDDDLDRENVFLKDILSRLPFNEGETAHLPEGSKLNFSLLIPANHTYVSYPGSLTTPPCSEGVLWHVLTTPMKMSLEQLHAVQEATGDSLCEVVVGGPEGDRGDTTASISGGGGPAPRGRKLLGPSAEVEPPRYQCKKLRNAQNYREVQPLLNRTLYAYKHV